MTFSVNYLSMWCQIHSVFCIFSTFQRVCQIHSVKYILYSIFFQLFREYILSNTFSQIHSVFYIFQLFRERVQRRPADDLLSNARGGAENSERGIRRGVIILIKWMIRMIYIGGLRDRYMMIDRGIRR